MTNETIINSYKNDAAAIRQRIVNENIKTLQEALDRVDIDAVHTAGADQVEALVSRCLGSPRNAWERELFAAIESGHHEFRLNPKATETDAVDVKAKMAALPPVEIPTMKFFN